MVKSISGTLRTVRLFILTYNLVIMLTNNTIILYNKIKCTVRVNRLEKKVRLFMMVNGKMTNHVNDNNIK